MTIDNDPDAPQESQENNEPVGCQSASVDTTVFDIPKLYYRVGQGDETVQSVIDVYVYDCDNALQPFTLTSDSSEISMSDCGEDCTDLFEAGILLSYTPTGA